MPATISRMNAYAKGLRRFYTGVPCKHGHVAERFVGNGGCTRCVNKSMAGIPTRGLAWNQKMAPTPLAFSASVPASQLTDEMLQWLWAFKVLPHCTAWVEEYWRDVVPARAARETPLIPTDKCNGVPLDVFAAAGWLDDALIAEGYAVRASVVPASTENKS